MSSSLPGHPLKPPTSLVSPLLQIVLGLGLFVLAWWAYQHSKIAPATDAWAYNGLSVIAIVFAVLWLPFAITALIAAIRNRRRGLDRMLH